MQQEIVIYEKDKKNLEFLKGFFKEKKDYVAIFAKDEKSLQREVQRRTPAAIVLGSPGCIEKMKPSAVAGCPVIAMVSDNIIESMRCVLKSDIECYLISSSGNEEFDRKLKMAINKKKWLENIYSEKKDLEAIVELCYLVSSTLDPKEVLYFVVRKIASIIDVTRCSMLSIPLDEKRYAYVVSTFEDPSKTSIKLDLKKYPEIRRAINTKNIVVIKDAASDPLMKEVRAVIAPLGIRSILVIPVVFRNAVIGTLFLRTSRAGNTFTDREISLCNAFASASTNALYNSFLFEKLETEKTKLEKLAITDYLTGIYNIRYFYHRLEQEFNRAQRYNTPLSCIMFDIDHFKKINDTYGHKVGDIVLREFAQCVRRHTRKTDVFARYGGEEFILLLTQTSHKGAIAEAERLRMIIKDYRFRALKNKRGITASIGIAFYPHKKIKTPDNIITLADNALFSAKANGRDRIMVSPELDR
ncbi:MAG: sensor domain-containing diguanylate cyclase [Nitrospirae bacterium]|nr:sensor domain-containing diguanylate cyclase [Nitrospirota bacterium]